MGKNKCFILLFAQLNEKGATIVMITHERSIAECAKKIYFIKDGQLSFERGGTANG